MSLANDPRWKLLEGAGPILTAAFESRGVIDTEFVAAWPDFPGAGVWLRTTTDRERDALRDDVTLAEAVRAVLIEVGFSPVDAASSGVVVQSQQTVDRDYEGSWFFAMR